jgi:hypothetical protein
MVWDAAAGSVFDAILARQTDKNVTLALRFVSLPDRPKASSTFVESTLVSGGTCRT